MKIKENSDFAKCEFLGIIFSLFEVLEARYVSLSEVSARSTCAHQSLSKRKYERTLPSVHKYKLQLHICDNGIGGALYCHSRYRHSRSTAPVIQWTEFIALVVDRTRRVSGFFIVKNLGGSHEALSQKKQCDVFATLGMFKAKKPLFGVA